MIATSLFGLVSCIGTQPPPPDLAVPGPMARQIMLQRMSAILVTRQDDMDGWFSQRFPKTEEAGDADGGSATPISPDGYFLTADHVLTNESGRHVFVLYGRSGMRVGHKARIVWRSKSADLALVHVDIQTPYYYQWTPSHQWLSPGYHVVHGGIATGFRSPVGRLRTPLAPEKVEVRARRFKIDIPLQPGDSGGPVLDAYGRLIGINSAVEFIIPMETPIFVDSEGCRPSVKRLEAIIRRDRAKRSARGPFH